MTLNEWEDKKNASAAAAAAPKPDVVDARPEDVRPIAESEKKKQAEKETKAEPELKTEMINGQEVVVTTSESAGVLALILGILSIIFGIFYGGAPWIGILLGVGGITIGAVERKRKNKKTKGVATGGFVCGIVGVSLSVVMGIVCFAISAIIKLLAMIF